MRRPPLVALAVGVACAPSTPTLDLSAPEVSSLVPADGAVGVSPTIQVVACFSVALEASTVTPTTVVLARLDGSHATPVAATASLASAATCLTLSPAAALSPSSHYRLTLTNKLLSASGIALASSKTATAFTASFETVGAAATATLLIPTDGMLTAPTNLAQVLVAFSAPVALASAAGPFTLSPGGGPATLSADGRLASLSLDGGVFPNGESFSITLSPSLVDPSGQVPMGGALEFAIGGCAETTPPGIGAGLAVARDTDALLQFAVDRPGLCTALVADPSCPDAGAVEGIGAACTQPYDPCTTNQPCLCNLPIVGLCPGDTVAAIPELQGFDGVVGQGPSASFQMSAPLPPLVLTEVRGGSKATAFVEVQNRGATALDLLGLSLADCQLSPGCSNPKTLEAFGPFDGVGTTILAPDQYALLVDPTYASTVSRDGGALLLSPQAQVSLLTLSDTHPQSLALFAPDLAAPLSTYSGALLPVATLSLERIDPDAPDALPGNWAFSLTPNGTPGACNSVTPGSSCDP